MSSTKWLRTFWLVDRRNRFRQQPATPRLGRRSTWLKVRTRGLKRWLTFPNYTRSEPRFCALLTEEAAEVKLVLS